MSLLKLFRKRAPRDERFVNNNVYNQSWERRPLPDPGAQNYAFETLDLYALTPVGPGVGQFNYIKPLQAQTYVLQAVPLQGIPLTSGQIYGAPLGDPQYNGPT